MTILKNNFEELIQLNSKVQKNGDFIEITPNYFIYSFLSIAIFLIPAIFILFQDINLKTYLLCLVTIVVSLLYIIKQLKKFNTIEIDLNNKVVTIIPNFIIGLVISKKKISFTSINKLDYFFEGFWQAYRYYVIRATLKDSEKINFTLFHNEEICKKTIEVLKLIFETHQVKS